MSNCGYDGRHDNYAAQDHLKHKRQSSPLQDSSLALVPPCVRLEVRVFVNALRLSALVNPSVRFRNLGLFLRGWNLGYMSFEIKHVIVKEADAQNKGARQQEGLYRRCIYNMKMMDVSMEEVSGSTTSMNTFSL